MGQHWLAPEAEAEIEDIWYYIARESGSIEIADRLIDAFSDRFLLLANHPYVGRPRDEDLRPGLRSFPIGEYLIIYRVENENVLILHIVRGGRNIEALFGR